MFGALTNQLTDLPTDTVGPTVFLYSLSCHIYPLSLMALSLLSPQKNIIFSQNSLDSKNMKKLLLKSFKPIQNTWK